MRQRVQTPFVSTTSYFPVLEATGLVWRKTHQEVFKTLSINLTLAEERTKAPAETKCPSSVIRHGAETVEGLLHTSQRRYCAAAGREQWRGRELPALAGVLPEGAEAGSAAALRVLQEGAGAVRQRAAVRGVGGVEGEAEEGRGAAVGCHDQEEADQGGDTS